MPEASLETRLVSQDALIEALLRRLAEKDEQLLQKDEQLRRMRMQQMIDDDVERQTEKSDVIDLDEERQAKASGAEGMERTRSAPISRRLLLGSMRPFHSRRRNTDDHLHCSKVTEHSKSAKQGKRTRRWSSFWKENKLDDESKWKVEDLRRSCSLPRGGETFRDRAWSFPCGRGAPDDGLYAAHVGAVFRGKITRIHLQSFDEEDSGTEKRGPSQTPIIDRRIGSNGTVPAHASERERAGRGDKSVESEALASQRRFLERQERADAAEAEE